MDFDSSSFSFSQSPGFSDDSEMFPSSSGFFSSYDSNSSTLSQRTFLWFNIGLGIFLGVYIIYLLRREDKTEQKTKDLKKQNERVVDMCKTFGQDKIDKCLDKFESLISMTKPICKDKTLDKCVDDMKKTVCKDKNDKQCFDDLKTKVCGDNDPTTCTLDVLKKINICNKDDKKLETCLANM